MAYYKIEKNKKGELRAKVQVHTKDFETGQDKIITKRVYNTQNLTEAKFAKYLDKYSLQFEDEVQEAYIEKNNVYKDKVLSFKELSQEFLDNVKLNLSINYFIRVEDTVKRFQNFLETIHLGKEPISAIKVRDVQLFLNSMQTYSPISSGRARLKKEFPQSINFRELEREKIIDRCSCYELRRRRKYITKEKADRICNYCNLNFNEYFILDDKVKSYSTETIKGHRRILRTIFNEAVRYDWIAKNPVCQTKVGSGGCNVSLRPIQEKEVFSIQEAKDFIKTVDALSDDLINKKIVFKFMILTGVRIAEMCGLRWSDIDFEKKVVHITRSRLHCALVGDYEKEPKTKTSIRDIPLNDVLLEDLRRFQKWFRIADSDFDRKLDEYYIAVNIYREKVYKGSVNSWLKDFEIKNGLKQVTCHGLRHTYCSLLLSQNVPIQTVSKYMGHSDSTITLKVYSHFIPDTQEKVVNALNNLL